MSDQHRIPRDADAAIERLASIGALVVAKEWDRAAIVYALCRDGRTSGNAEMTFGQLAEKGIVGLRDQETISHYRACWQYAVDQGVAEPVTLGSVYVTPDLGFPPNPTVGRGMDSERRDRLMEAGREAGMRSGSKVVDVAANPRALRTAIESDPETFKVAREAVSRAEFAEAVRSVGGGTRQGTVPDPEPRWHQLTRRIFMDVMEVKTEIGQMRENGQHNTADRALIDLRAVLAQAVSELEEVPDTIEGIDA